MNGLPNEGLALAALDAQILQPGTKGLPISAPLVQGEIGRQGWNILRGETSFPVAVLKTSALNHNLASMRSFCDRHGVLLAPHGKTTMSPQLFGAQLASGAWGITLATMSQVLVAHRFGVRRVLLANQLVASTDIALLRNLMLADPGFECVALADSLAGVARLAAANFQRPLPLLVELGVAGKRAGCRTEEEVMAVARAIAAAPGLQMAGIEGYEGLLDGPAQVDAFIGRLLALVRRADAEGLFGADAIIVSAGGSAYFDLVAQGFGATGRLSRAVLPIMRSGCYLTSDHRFYQKLIADMATRSPGLHHGALREALEVWSVVQSRPDSTLAILSMGKRDASSDIDLPIPLMAHRPGQAAPTTLEGCHIEKMNDQHACLRIPATSTLAVGDLVGCGISHPCTTFDKWPLMLAVDDDYTVRFAINTFF
ncbi:MAG: alanine racemase [Pseudomonadota bacterium]